MRWMKYDPLVRLIAEIQLEFSITFSHQTVLRGCEGIAHKSHNCIDWGRKTPQGAFLRLCLGEDSQSEASWQLLEA